MYLEVFAPKLLQVMQMVDHIVFAWAEWEWLLEQVMVVVDFQKVCDSVTFALVETTLVFLGLGESYVRPR